MRPAAYRVLSPLDHDLRRYAPGETVGLDAAAAEPLLAAGVIEALTGAAAPEAGAEEEVLPARTAGGGEGARAAALLAAIPGLEPGNEDHWTKSGRPEVRALEAATGLGGVTAAERDTAWAAHREGVA